MSSIFGIVSHLLKQSKRSINHNIDYITSLLIEIWDSEVSPNPLRNNNKKNVRQTACVARETKREHLRAKVAVAARGTVTTVVLTAGQRKHPISFKPSRTVIEIVFSLHSAT